ncbi:MAG TPA: phage tail sheath C-terminal domain-containing protein, partial [Dongiaceae bacterium]|nr:phage tail sheath C-terminal domain-containing protein [Dongiaceae bacterium]
FGLPDDINQPDDGSHPLTLTRAIQLLYGNGATSIVAVRVAGPSRASATYAVLDKNGRTVATLTAKTPGTWANDMTVAVEPADADCVISGEQQTSGFTQLRYGSVLASPQNRFRITRGATRRVIDLAPIYKQVLRDQTITPAAGHYVLPLPAGRSVENVPGTNSVRVVDASGTVVRTYGDGAILYGAGAPPKTNELRIASDTGEITFEASQVPTAAQKVVATFGVGSPAPTSGQVLVTSWDGTLTFAPGEAPVAANGDTLSATYVLDRSACVKVTLVSGTTTERYTVPDGRLLARLVQQSSALVTAAADATSGANAPAPVGATRFGTGSNTPGGNGAEADANAYADGLATIENMLINIVVLAGQKSGALGSTLLAHLNATAETEHERIGVIGAPGWAFADFLGNSVVSDRVVVVAPRISDNNGTPLSTGFTAAAVAGLISSLPVQGSLTNQVVNVAGLATKFNRGEEEQLIRRNILALVDKEGFRIAKGITTSGEGTAFSAIPTRRIVDYAKYGVRSAANSYLGKLNNDRVRAALKATLDAFLTRMVQSEALTGYQLEVTATRAQEIAGAVQVTMTLQPTFSIEYIQVTMILK